MVQAYKSDTLSIEHLVISLLFPIFSILLALFLTCFFKMRGLCKLTTDDPPATAAQCWACGDMPSYFYGAGSSKAGALTLSADLPSLPALSSTLQSYSILDYLVYRNALEVYIIVKVTAELLRPCVTRIRCSLSCRCSGADTC